MSEVEELVERLKREAETSRRYSSAIYDARLDTREQAAATITRLSEENERLRDALTPSSETKAEYIGEFCFDLPSGYDKHGNELNRSVDVPWTTIKEIMAAIRRYAALTQGESSHG